LNARNLSFVTGLRAIEGGGDARLSWIVFWRHRFDLPAAEHAGREQDE
jgi:hypothetical protein